MKRRPRRSLLRFKGTTLMERRRKELPPQLLPGRRAWASRALRRRDDAAAWASRNCLRMIHLINVKSRRELVCVH
jgi:hypothetical protein